MRWCSVAQPVKHTLLPQVGDYIGLLPDFPNVDFVKERLSEGERGCAFTWKVIVNGDEGPSGISFKQCNEDGKVVFVRDIPAPSLKPPPLGRLAGALRPRLRMFRAKPT